MMKNNQPIRIHDISEYHRLMGLPGPAHPQISLINLDEVKRNPSFTGPVSLVFDFYSISLKRNPGARYKYGQQHYDFNNGILFFLAPGQVFGIDMDAHALHTLSGYILLVHPDFLWGTPLAQKIKSYEYFGYAINEALHLSEKEEQMMLTLLQQIGHEYSGNIDRFSQEVMIAQLELLLTYGDRFYQRQFITRRVGNHLLLDKLEALLEAHFAEGESLSGLPTVQSVSAQLHVSPGYLGSMLRMLTGRSPQEHIHDKLIEKAKEKLSTTDLSVSEIAYGLGFEHPQSFSRLFKIKTQLSPVAFRQSFN